MFTVCVALIPGLLLLIHYFGWSYLVNALLALVAAVLAEMVLLRARQRPFRHAITDGSAAVTALLLACALPPLVPWWLVISASVLAILFGKHLFGGLGQNPFNPAMLAYAFLLVAWPLPLTSGWVLPGQGLALAPAVELSFGYSPSRLDGLTGATPLGHYAANIGSLLASDVRQHPLYADFGAVGWTPVNVAFLLGGLLLLQRQVISWHIPVSLLLALSLMSLTFGADADLAVPLSLQLFSGSTMLAAFFIATDPVSAATSRQAKLFYGAGIGLLIYSIRRWGHYPDATAFAVLLMNFMAPLLDHCLRPQRSSLLAKSDAQSRGQDLG